MDIVKRAYSHGQSARHLSAIVTVNIIQMILQYRTEIRCLLYKFGPLLSVASLVFVSQNSREVFIKTHTHHKHNFEDVIGNSGT